MGLYSISHPNTWYTLQNGNNHIFYDDNKNCFFSWMKIDHGYGQEIQDLIRATNEALAKNVSDNNKFTVNTLTGNVTYSSYKRWVKTYFIWTNVYHLWVWREGNIYNKNDRKPIRWRHASFIDDLPVL